MEYQDFLNLIYYGAHYRQAEAYFEKYWLSEAEYLEKWRSIQMSIFNAEARRLPDMMFNNGFELYPLVGGDIFISKSDFQTLQECVFETGDSYLVIIQNRHIMFEGWPLTRFKYPTNISWDELMSGGVFGSEHFNNGCKEYFVFGNTGKWGRYVANSWIVPGRSIGNPINIMGFKGEFADLFRNKFEEVRLSEPEITPDILLAEWLPEGYRERVN